MPSSKASKRSLSIISIAFASNNGDGELPPPKVVINPTQFLKFFTIDDSEIRYTIGSWKSLAKSYG